MDEFMSNSYFQKTAKTFVLTITIFASVISDSISANTLYVSDALPVFLRSGPTHQFRIVGTLVAGDAVELIIEDIDNEATKVRLSTGREVWVDTKQLMNTKPSSLLLKETQSKLSKLQKSSNLKISDLQLELIKARDQAAMSQGLQQQVTQLEYDKELLEQKNQSLGERSRYDLLTAGGVVAIAGLILGLLIPTFIRRKRNDVWR